MNFYFFPLTYIIIYFFLLSHKYCILELFRGTMHQDAHEFFNYLLNSISETVMKHRKEYQERQKAKPPLTTMTSSLESSNNVNSPGIRIMTPDNTTPRTVSFSFHYHFCITFFF